ncbi:MULTISPECIES: DUF1636 family protein [unclassified Paracoccus (in: a-proteobacteria)]|uniref:DUF1636 family protein n=1 Tax=unclassified Paracoccus (in: a-proteobacteria) TaxID=2688777 RepID=UPI0012B1D3CA|nr:MULTISPECIES: DUF1636 family protein [unclassified Paracoccus (in: a-proteobacteria)]UXU75972.1 DUF1636 family protein [Paracoccus sp. SMMA_5]UXU81881.1 DUF1636 family protein [Paracoccus sp. SMMA_5_TC]
MPAVLTLPAGAGADKLAELLAARLPAEVALRRAALRAPASRPLLMTMQAPGRASYVFHGLRAADLDDILATLALWRAAPGGWISDARPCGRLRHCLWLRLPATDPGETPPMPTKNS